MGQKIGEYVVDGELGRAAFGTVYAAHQPLIVLVDGQLVGAEPPRSVEVQAGRHVAAARTEGISLRLLLLLLLRRRRR